MEWLLVVLIGMAIPVLWVLKVLIWPPSPAPEDRE